VAGAVGVLLERTVIRWLYGRPLETLLATWGISLMLMQLVRTVFGAQNVEVANPSWMSGGVTVLGSLVLSYNRIVIIVFAVLVVAAVWLILNKTRLGLFVRAVMQNRRMADCVGVPTGRIDMMTFGLGSGIAGLGGVALSQLGNVGPDLGQAYIVDSFMVVVLGGVGQLAGTVIAALGLGEVNKFLEPAGGRRAGQDRHPRLHHHLHPAPAARAVRAEGKERRMRPCPQALFSRPRVDRGRPVRGHRWRGCCRC
jgi:urea transport system permease protein